MSLVAEGVYDPQPIAQMRQRFGKAIDHIHFPEQDIGKPQSEWPASDPVHVFDFEDGMRLIVSRDQVFSRGSFIHVSASMNPESPLYRKITPLTSRQAWQEIMIAHLEQISNFAGEVIDHFIGDPPKHVLHLFFREL